MTKALAHMGRVKELPCGLCGAPGPERNERLYIKLSLSEDSKTVIMSFKQDGAYG